MPGSVWIANHSLNQLRFTQFVRYRLVLCKRSFDSLGALGGDRQIPDSRRDLTIPTERLNPQNFGHGLLVQCQGNFASLG